MTTEGIDQESASLNRSDTIAGYETKDGSTIRELMHPTSSIAEKQSLAEALVAPGEVTLMHYHQKTEELYFIIQGKGLMMLGDEHFEVTEGDTVCIKPGVRHHIKNLGSDDLKFLCCCSPAYCHEDTYLLDSDNG